MIRLILSLFLTFHSIPASPIAEDPPRFENNNIANLVNWHGHSLEEIHGHSIEEILDQHHLKKREVVKDHGHSLEEEIHGHSLEEKHGHSIEEEMLDQQHNLKKREVVKIDPMEFDLDQEIELDAERVEMIPNEKV